MGATTPEAATAGAAPAIEARTAAGVARTRVAAAAADTPPATTRAITAAHRATSRTATALMTPTRNPTDRLVLCQHTNTNTYFYLI